MLIAFDGRYAEDDLVGVGKYIKNLIENVSQKENCIIFYSKKPKFKIEGENIRSVVFPFRNRYLFEQIALPMALIHEKVDVYHALGNIGVPFLRPIPVILTVHDIIPLEIKNYFSYSPFPILSKVSYLLRLRTSLAWSSRIITVSNYVKNELTKKMNVNISKVHTIFSGISTNVGYDNLPANLVGKKYILNHGGIDIRKNLDILIRSFAVVYKRHKDISLVITGNNSKIVQQLKILIKKLGLGTAVVFTGYVEESVLNAVIKNSMFICYPTLSEGFGFPVLEGFASGVPVITSNTSAIPEIAGNAAILIDPKNVDEIAQAIELLIKDRKLAQKMVLRGKKQCTKFDWENSINEYLDLYHNI